MTSLKTTDATSPNPGTSDSGITMPLVALMMVTLLGLAAFAVDLGWFYLNASKIQRAADASALAGVIHMPTDFTEASVVAHEIAQSNGYEDLEILGVYPHVEAAAVPSEPTQLKVTVTEEVPTFFLKVFGMSTQVITRTAQAEFVPPLPLGSPDNQFGNSCDPTQSGCVGQPNFWANIHGRYTDTISGDAFSSACLNKTGSPCNDPNDNEMFRDDLHKRPGYLYGIEATGASFGVEFTDIAFHNESGGHPTGDLIRTGDHSCGTSDPVTCGPTVRVALYPPDTTPLDVTDGTAICTQDIVPEAQVAVTDLYDWDSPNSCFANVPAQPGIYVLQVRILSTGPSPVGLNRYAVRSTPATTTRLYALGDMSIFNNSTASVTSFHLAEVSDIYAGKTFVVELYDSGDSSANGTLELIDPSGNVFNDGPCDIYSRQKITDPWVFEGSPVDCAEVVHPQEYNGHWLKFEVVLPSTYSCTDCWWKMNYDYSGGTQDTTTWRAYMLGNPIHLVPLS